jgi:hypothetical protein
MWGALSDERPGLVYNCCWPSPAQSFSGPSPVGLAITFYCLRFETSLFVASYDSQGYDGDIRPHLHTGLSVSQSQSQIYDTTDGQSASLSWIKAPIWGLRPDLYYCVTFAGLITTESSQSYVTTDGSVGQSVLA